MHYFKEKIANSFKPAMEIKGGKNGKRPRKSSNINKPVIHI